MKHKIKVGQTLWYAPHDTRRAAPHEITVEKVGKKYIYADFFQHSIDRIGIACGRDNTGVFLSKEHQADCIRIKELAIKVVAWLGSDYSFFHNATHDQVERMAAIMNEIVK